MLMLLASWLMSTARADDVQYLSRPQQALAAFHTLISEARDSIDITTFIFEPCHSSTQLLLESLADRARRGVRVRILLDSLQQNAARERQLADFAARQGGTMEFRFYNSRELNMRLHIKLMVVDGQRYVAGGRNISDEYFSLSEENNYIDRDLLVSGPSAMQAQTSFNELWNSRNTSRKSGSATRFAGWPSVCGSKLGSKIDETRSYLRRNSASLLSRVARRDCAHVGFYSDNPAFAGGANGPAGSRDPYMDGARMSMKRSTRATLRFLNAARTTLDLENWVYIPVYHLSDAFKNARGRGVRTRVLTNQDIEDGPQVFRDAMDYAIAKHAARDSKNGQSVTLISSKGGLRSEYELTPPNVPVHLHGKIAIRDQKDVLVGSFNLDARSYNTNLESVVQVTGCPALADDLQLGFDQLLNIHRDDVRFNRVPPKREPSAAAKALAFWGLMLF